MSSQHKIPIESHNPDVTSNLLQKASENKGPTFGKRHIQVIMLALIQFCSFLMRTTLSVTIVAMTDPSASTNKDIPTYNWTDKSLVVGSFLWGYCLPQMGAGFLADRYGGKWFIVGATGITALFGLLTPTVANHFGSHGVIGLRFVQGFSQGFLYPCVQGILGKWIPSQERSILGTIVYSGPAAGIVVSMLLSGYISASHYGWPMVFYSLNGVSMIICAIFMYLGSSSPSTHSSITFEEKMYIVTNLDTPINKSKLKVPWKHIMRSPPFYALTLSNIAFSYTHWSMVTETAIYMNKVMHFDLKSNSVLTSLPYLLEIVMASITSFIANYLLKNNLVSTTFVRKSADSSGLVVGALSLFLLTQIGPDSVYLTVALVVLVGAFHGPAKSGHCVNHMDLAPNFSGILMGFTNGSAIIASAFAPILAHIVIKDETNVNQWNIVFYFSVIINIIALMVLTLFSSGERQYWNEPIPIDSERNLNSHIIKEDK